MFWPEDGLTKGDLLEYYRRRASGMVPYLAGRPLTVVRYPDGIDGESWFQKDIGDDLPEWMRRATLGDWEDNDVHHAVAEEPAALVVLAQLGAIEIHAGPCDVDDLDHPSELVFDLDPPAELQHRDTRRAARRLHALLEDELGLTTFVKTTGSKGFHVHVPLARRDDVESVRRFAKNVATLLTERHPRDLTVEHRKSKRGDRVFIDWLRNHPAQTSVAPYSVRGKRGAPVATPLAWDELSGGVAPDRYTMKNLQRRLSQREDPWSGRQDVSQDLRTAARRLAETEA